MKTKKMNGTSWNSAHQRATPRRLLVPVDFSDASLSALDHAARLAAEWDASLTIVHVVPSDDGWFGIGREDYRDLDKSLQKQAAGELETVATNALHQIKAELEVRIGRPADEIAEAAAEAKADLIILPTHGRTGLDRYVIGSVAESLLRLAPCPVYLMPLRNLSPMPDRSRSVAVQTKRKG